MATINASTGADIVVPNQNGTTYRGLEGNDTYIISSAIAANAKVTIVDTNGSNTIQLVDGLSITSSKFAADSVQLTLSNGAVVTVNGADKFTFEVGGNETAGVTGSSNTYAELASAMGVSSLPTGSTISDGSSGTVSGTSVSGSASSYTLSADANSVAEGGTLTYTVTANAAVSADTTFTYNVAGDDNGATVDKAQSGDTDSLSGTVTIASGSTSATFTVTATADNAAEGLEGIKVSVFDSNNNVIGSNSALISNNADLETTIQNLTTVIDEIAGGAGKDTIGGSIGANSTAANGTTAAAGDSIDGGAGIDTFKLSIAGTHNSSQTLSALTLKNVENVEVNNFELDTTNTDTINTALFDDQLLSVGLTASGAGGDTLFTNLAKNVDVNAKQGSGDLTVSFNATALAGTADSITVNIDAYTGSLDIGNNAAGLDALESIVINGGATKSTLPALTAGNLTSITFTGDTKTTLGSISGGTGAMGASLKTIDMSASTGGVEISLATTATSIVTGGSGNDVVNYDSSLNAAGADFYDGGEGTDTIVIDTAASLTALSGSNVSNVEVLATNSTDSNTFDMSLIAGATTFRVMAGAAADGTGVSVKNLPAEVNIEIQGTEGLVGLLALNTAADTANITIATASGLGVIMPAAGTITLSEFETINITSGVSAVDTDDLTAASMTAVTFSGYGPITSNIASGVLSSIDASGMFGLTTGLTMEGNTGSVLFPQTITGSNLIDTLIGAAAADTINGNGGNDIINGGASIDTINGGAGNDTLDGDGGADIISGGAGNDVLSIDTDVDFITLATPEVFDGGEGTDIVRVGDSNGTTIASTDLLGLKNVEILDMRGEAALSVTLNDQFFTNNGSTTFSITQSKTAAGLPSTAGALTVVASSLTSANSITAALNPSANIDDSLTGGAGDDTFTLLATAVAATALEATDTITGGKGDDTLAITIDDFDVGASGTNITLSLVTGIEKITVTSGNTKGAFLTLTDGQFVTGATAATSGNGTTAAIVGLIDGSGMTGSGPLVVNGAAEDDSKLEMIGGAGADILTGGSKADTISGNGGNDILNGEAGIDIITGGAGNDELNITDVSDFIGLTAVETFDGGTGTDTVTFDEDATTTVAASDLQGLKNVEKLSFEGTGANTVTLSDSVFTNNGTTSLKVYDANANGAVTLDAAGLSAVNSIKYYATTAAAGTTDTVTGGSGDDFMSFLDDTLADADVLNGGAGTDTLAVKLDGGNLATVTTTNMTKFEVINITSDASARTSAITLTAGFFQGTSGTVNAQTVTGAVTFNGAAETLTPLTISTGVAGDTITGGAKADTIKSGTGDDIVDGSSGADIISGGAGADDFQYDNGNALGAVSDSSGVNYDTYTDFLSGTDEFDFTVSFAALNSGVTVNATTLTATSSKTLAQDSLSGKRLEAIYNTTDELLYINYNEDNLITTSDFTIKINPGASAATTVASADLNWSITGTAAADTITTGAGDDTIAGGSGVDTINGGKGTNAISDSAGDDVIYISNTGIDAVNVTTGDDDVKITSATDSMTIITLTDITGAGQDFTVSATSHDQLTGFSTTNDDVKITGALYTAVAVGKTAPGTTLLAGSGQTADLDAGGVIIANANEKLAAAYTATTNGLGDLSSAIASMNTSLGSNSAANEEYVVFLGDSGTVYGAYYWKDVDGDSAISDGDQLALLATISGAVLVAADVDAAAGS
jgi:hypothetical protein